MACAARKRFEDSEGLRAARTMAASDANALERELDCVHDRSREWRYDEGECQPAAHDARIRWRQLTREGQRKHAHSPRRRENQRCGIRRTGHHGCERDHFNTRSDDARRRAQHGQKREPHHLTARSPPGARCPRSSGNDFVRSRTGPTLSAGGRPAQAVNGPVARMGLFFTPPWRHRSIASPGCSNCGVRDTLRDDDTLIPPHQHDEVENVEDRLFIPTTTFRGSPRRDGCLDDLGGARDG